MEQHLLEAVSDGVATLTLNRPERLNALSTPIMDGLLEALPRLARDSAVGAIVLTRPLNIVASRDVGKRLFRSLAVRRGLAYLHVPADYPEPRISAEFVQFNEPDFQGEAPHRAGRSLRRGQHC